LLFPSYLEKRALRWFNALTPAIKGNFSAVTEEFDRNFIKANLVLKEHTFHRLVQKPGQSVEKYIEEFEELLPAATTDTSDHGLMMKFTSGLKEALKPYVLLHHPANFAAAKEQSRLAEQVLPEHKIRALSEEKPQDIQPIFSGRAGDMKQVIHEIQQKSKKE
jgi:hypothetical protein